MLAGPVLHNNNSLLHPYLDLAVPTSTQIRQVGLIVRNQGISCQENSKENEKTV